MKDIFPITIDIRRNPYFFAKIDWLLWKLFKRKPKQPCGRRRKEKYLCCCQPLDNDRVYLEDDGKKAICKCCGSCRIMSNHPLDEKDVFGTQW